MTYNFWSSMLTAAAFPDERFAAFLLAADALAAKLDSAKRLEVISSALACGRAVAEELNRDCGNVAPSEMARMLGIKVSEADLPGSRVLMSVYEPGSKEIILNRSALTCLDRIVTDHSLVDLFGPFSVAETAISHELFHHIEDGDHTLYTRSKIITLWRIGPFQCRSTLPSAGEMAAMACAKSLCRLPFNPVLLEAVLLQANGADKSAAWLESLEKTA